MMLKALGAVLILGLSFAILAVLMQDLTSAAETARTEDATESDTCTTGAAESACSFNLNIEHAYATKTELAVTETSPGAGDVTGNSSLDPNRVTITVSSLATSTIYAFAVDHKIVGAGVSTLLNSVMSRFGLIVVVGLLGLLLFWIGKVVKTF